MFRWSGGARQRENVAARLRLGSRRSRIGSSTAASLTNAASRALRLSHVRRHSRRSRCTLLCAGCCARLGRGTPTRAPTFATGGGRARRSAPANPCPDRADDDVACGRAGRLSRDCACRARSPFRHGTGVLARVEPAGDRARAIGRDGRARSRRATRHSGWRAGWASFLKSPHLPGRCGSGDRCCRPSHSSQ
jgi:hypothetical protein